MPGQERTKALRRTVKREKWGELNLSHEASNLTPYLDCVKKNPQAKVVGDQAKALREIKLVIAEHMKLEAELDQKVRRRLESYSRTIPEGSQEWDVLYQKTFEEELRKRKLG